MSALALLWLVMAAAGHSAGAPHGNSGIYLEKQSGGVSLVQLVEAPDHHVTGRIETRRVNADGSIADDVNVIDGTASGADMTLIFHPTWTNAGISATAHRDGDTLSISSRGEVRALKRGTLKDYEEDEATLSGLAELARLNATVRSLSNFENNAELKLANYQHVRANIASAGDVMPKRTSEMRALLVAANGVEPGKHPPDGGPKEKMQEILNHSVENFNKAKSLRDQLPEMRLSWRSEFVGPEAECASLSTSQRTEIRLATDTICPKIRSVEKELNAEGVELEAEILRYISVAKVEGPEQIQLMKEVRSSCLQRHNC